ncbi:MAG: hypothetical protein GOMPHAMPRED_005911 [Gomphillus americanus]|uniref:FMN hydroxy acid dehydrogenase domain-containing protein n=1 Tax=Gomphillus americanus TaxID=1940652 RepID=A0A8H3IWP5_9LECA|nr:MAG: hypothetical protein GOMPHAMPRED_005911 [Gomphillus americanus]
MSSSHINGIAAVEQCPSEKLDLQDNSTLSTSTQKSHRSYSTYQEDIYRLGLVGKKPVLSTNPTLWPVAAKAAITPEAWGYLEGGGGTSSTMAANSTAFNRWKIIPRMLTGNNSRSLKTTLFGQEYPSPLIMAPVGVNKIFHPEGEEAVAKACAAVGVPYTISTASSTTIEDIATAGSPETPRFFQLYWPRSQDNDITLSLLSRAWNAGCRVLLVTVDTWSLGWRPADLDHSYIPFYNGTGCQIGLSDPVFQKKYLPNSSTANKSTPSPEELTTASLAWLQSAFSGTSRTWTDLSFLRSNWKGSLVVKGIQSSTDALHALEAGCDGIVISNHGGRQYDGAAGSLSVLPEIADVLHNKQTAAGQKMTLLFDSGIRCGADALKALALGADGVLVGRPVMYGLAAAGREGAEHVLRCLLADLEINLGVMGYSDLGQVGRSDLRE